MSEYKESSDRPFRERTFFHTYSQRRIYTVEYIPDQNSSLRHGVILCKPVWGERIRTHRIFTNFARMLAARGFHVVTCDYFGDGNSAGDSIELDIPGMVRDSSEVSACLTEKYGIAQTTCLGMLIGANVAYLAASKIKNLIKMILIQPVLNPIEHLEAALRSNLSSQMVVHKKVIKDRPTLINEIKSGISVNVDGFMLGNRMWESYAHISPFTDQKTEFNGPVTLIGLKKKASKGTDYSGLQKNFQKCERIEIEQEFVWTDWKVYQPKPPRLFQILHNEIAGHAENERRPDGFE